MFTLEYLFPSSLTRRRKLSLVCACALINAFASLYAVPSLLGVCDRRQRSPETPELFRNEMTSDEKLAALSDRRVDDNELLRSNGYGLTGSGNSSARYISLEFGYPMEPSAIGRRELCEITNETSLPHDIDDDVTVSRASLLILVCSAVENVDRRNSIRSTWGNRDRLKTLGVRLVFVVALPQQQQHQQRHDADGGRREDFNAGSEMPLDGADYAHHVLEEQRHHDDIVQLGFVDHYVNLTFKTIGALRWAVTRCPHINYVTKTDDDIFLNVAALVQRLVNEEDHFRSAFGEATSRSFIIGHVIDSAKPIHDRRFKWYTPKTMFSGEFYPPYVSGTGYSMSTDVARRLIIEADKTSGQRTGRRLSGTRGLFWLEDICVTGMLAARLDDVRLVHDERFNSVRRRTPKALTMTSENRTGSHEDDEKLAEICWYAHEVITVHDLTPGELVSLWRRLEVATMKERRAGWSSEKVNVDRLCAAQSVRPKPQTNGEVEPPTDDVISAEAEVEIDSDY